MTVPPDIVDAATEAHNRIIDLMVDASDLSADDRRAIAAAGRAFVEACEAARRRVDDVLRVEDELGKRINDLERELDQHNRLIESVRTGIVPPADLKPREAGHLGLVPADARRLRRSEHPELYARLSGAAASAEPEESVGGIMAADRVNVEARVARLRETLADLPRRDGESEYDYGARRDAILDEIRALQARVGDEASEGALVKARRALGGG